MLAQIIYELYMKGLKDADMKTIKAIGWESLSGELEYLYDCRKLINSECPKEFGQLRGKINAEYRKQFPKFPKWHQNYVEDDGGCPGLKENLEWVKNEEKLKMKEKQESQIKVPNQVTSSSNEDLGREDTNECSSVSEEEEEPRTLCEYERLREKNIQERMEKMAESNYFDDLNELKMKIGLYKSK